MAAPSIGSTPSGRAASSAWIRASVIAGLDRDAPAFVALGLEAVGELGTAGLDDATVDQEVHAVGLEVVEEPLVLGDRQHTQVGLLLANLLHAAGHRLECIDVETRIGLVEDRQVRLEDGELQDLVALLLAPGEAVVQVAVREGGIHVEPLHPLADAPTQLEDRDLLARASLVRLAE